MQDQDESIATNQKCIIGLIVHDKLLPPQASIIPFSLALCLLMTPFSIPWSLIIQATLTCNSNPCVCVWVGDGNKDKQMVQQSNLWAGNLFMVHYAAPYFSEDAFRMIFWSSVMTMELSFCRLLMAQHTSRSWMDDMSNPLPPPSLPPSPHHHQVITSSNSNNNAKCITCLLYRLTQKGSSWRH